MNKIREFFSVLREGYYREKQRRAFYKSTIQLLNMELKAYSLAEIAEAVIYCRFTHEQRGVIFMQLVARIGRGKATIKEALDSIK